MEKKLKEESWEQEEAVEALEPEEILCLLIVTGCPPLLCCSALVDVLQRVESLQLQLLRPQAGQLVLLRKQPGLQARLVASLPLRVLQRRLVDLPHGLQRAEESWHQSGVDVNIN